MIGLILLFELGTILFLGPANVLFSVACHHVAGVALFVASLLLRRTSHAAPLRNYC